MNRIDKLIAKAKPNQVIHDILQKDNKYLQMSYSELKEYMRLESGKEHPQKGTLEHAKYMYALLQARINRKKLIK